MDFGLGAPNVFAQNDKATGRTALDSNAEPHVDMLKIAPHSAVHRTISRPGQVLSLSTENTTLMTVDKSSAEDPHQKTVHTFYPAAVPKDDGSDKELCDAINAVIPPRNDGLNFVVRYKGRDVSSLIDPTGGRATFHEVGRIWDTVLRVKPTSYRKDEQPSFNGGATYERG